MGNRRRPSPNAPGGAMGDMISDLHGEGHISARQLRAALAFLNDLHAWHGSSEGLVMGDMQDRVQLCRGARLWPPGGSSSASLAALDARLNRLRGHERRLMASLVKCRELARGSLSDLGRQLSGYKTARTTRAVMVGRIGALLDTLADEYLGPERV